MEKFLENLQEADRLIQKVDHMIYVTFPLIKDKNLLLKTMLEIKTAVAGIINSILQYEYLYKRISLYKSSKENLKTFQNLCAPKYGITEQELTLILELFDLAEKHKQSPFEFVKDDKVVILSNNLKSQTVTLEDIKKYLFLAKSIFRKARMTIIR